MKNVTENIGYGRKDGWTKLKQYTPSSSKWGYNYFQLVKSDILLSGKELICKNSQENDEILFERNKTVHEKE